MNISLLKYHGKLLAVVATLISMSILVVVWSAELKAISEISLLDVVGEGSVSIITLVWIFFILISRPIGRVTNFLVIGLLFVHISSLMDVLDEFFLYSSDVTWQKVIESVPAPIGMFFMTLGLYHWHKEQLVVNEQLRRRERFHREHGLCDFITGLYSADYMIQQLEQEMTESARDFSVLMLDIDRFDNFIRQHGDSQGDRMLREVADLILMNIRTTDLACRYAGDRFIVLLPETDIDAAQQISLQIQESVAHLAFKPEKSTKAVYHSISVSLSSTSNRRTVDELLAELNKQMELMKIVLKKDHVA